MLKGVREILAICKAHNVPNGWFHTTLDNVEQVIQDGYRVLMAPSSRSYAVLQQGPRRGRQTLSAARRCAAGGHREPGSSRLSCGRRSAATFWVDAETTSGERGAIVYGVMRTVEAARSQDPLAGPATPWKG